MIKAMALRPGDVCVFRTSPFSTFSEPATGRYAALKVLTVGDKIAYAVLDGIFTERPNLGQVAHSPVLRNKRFNFKDTPALHSTSSNWDIDLLDFAVLGNVGVAPTDLALIPRFPSFGTWRTACSDAEGEWRWRHDQDAFKREVQLDRESREAKQRGERERYDERLKHLTWEALMAETLFTRWSPSPPFPPDSFTEVLRRKFRNAMLELQGMGLKPSKKAARQVLHTLVNQINRLDAAHGQVIETEEREDVCAALGDLALLARHPALMEDVASWRTW
jgi:hypothetical protein